MALGARLAGRDARIFVELSDGEMQEGSTWEAAMSAAAFRLDNLVALVDCNGIQADGRVVLDMEPVAEKWRAFGFDTVEVDGNDIEQLVNALHFCRTRNRRPKAIVLRTLPGRGVPALEVREKAHFLRVEPGEWTNLIREFEKIDG
jgi:transketolase